MNINLTFFENSKPIWTQYHGPLDCQSFKSVLFHYSRKNGNWKSKTYIFSSNWIIKEKGEGNLTKMIDLENILVEKISYIDKDLENQTFHGFRLTRGNKDLDSYASSIEGVDYFFKYIKQYAIQTQFYDVYSLGSKIGQGNFAKVFIAKNNMTKQDFAVKVFSKSSFKNPKIDKPALIKEISILRKLNHRGVIQLYEVFESENNIYLVKELLKGGELLKKLKKSTCYSEKYVAQVMIRLFSALEYIHERGILHRDIKPENLILHTKENNYDICLADFGLADYFDPEGNYIFKRCGTPGYVAPELLQDKIYDTKIDIFSAGTLMFLMLAGRQAFAGNTYDEVVIKNYNCEIDFGDLHHKLSPEANQLLRSLLNKNPKSRPTAIECLQHDWFFKVLNNDEIYLTLQMYSEIKTVSPSDNYNTPLMTQVSTESSSQSPDYIQQSPDLSIQTKAQSISTPTSGLQSDWQSIYETPRQDFAQKQSLQIDYLKDAVIEEEEDKWNQFDAKILCDTECSFNSNIKLFKKSHSEI